MKELFDCTVKEFDKKVTYERNNMKSAYEKILSEQRKQFKVNEIEYNHLMLKKIKKIEDFAHELAIDQAKLLEKVISNNEGQSDYEERGLFPKSKEGNHGFADS